MGSEIKSSHAAFSRPLWNTILDELKTGDLVSRFLSIGIRPLLICLQLLYMALCQALEIPQQRSSPMVKDEANRHGRLSFLVEIDSSSLEVEGDRC